jgi:two-component system OmpR family response regulator
MKVMIVDDDEDIRLICELAIRRVGKWDFVGAASGEEALELVQSERPDVILLDVMMPGIDGPTTFARLRERPETRRIPVVFLTAKAQQREVERYLALGATGVICKPFDVIKLADEIRAIVEGG